VSSAWSSRPQSRRFEPRSGSPIARECRARGSPNHIASDAASRHDFALPMWNTIVSRVAPTGVRKTTPFGHKKRCLRRHSHRRTTHRDDTAERHSRRRRAGCHTDLRSRRSTSTRRRRGSLLDNRRRSDMRRCWSPVRRPTHRRRLRCSRRGCWHWPHRRRRCCGSSRLFSHHPETRLRALPRRQVRLGWSCRNARLRPWRRQRGQCVSTVTTSDQTRAPPSYRSIRNGINATLVRALPFCNMVSGHRRLLPLGLPPAGPAALPRVRFERMWLSGLEHRLARPERRRRRRKVVRARLRSLDGDSGARGVRRKIVRFPGRRR
jgi:hypothetical protein